MAEQETLKVRFPGLDTGDAGAAASDLLGRIEDDLPEASVRIDKDDRNTMDFGATLVVLLGTPAVIALAKGIAKWMAAERTDVEIEINSEKITVKASGTVNENLARMVEALRQIKPDLQ